MSICGFEDTSRITVYNISSSVITGVSITVSLPPGVQYIKGSVVGSGVAESNVSNPNKPIFSGPNLLIAQNFNLRIRVKSNCDILSFLGGNGTPQVDVRVDYSGNYDGGSSIPFVPIIPSPGFASITNLSFIGNVGDKFVRRVTITNYGKGPLRELVLMRINGKDLSGNPQTGFTNTISGDTIRTFFKASDFLTVGDKDTLLEQNESITITDTLLIKGCNKITTYYELGWGCGGKTCQLTKNNASVTISSDNPNLKAWAAYKDKLCYDAVTPNQQYLTFTNTGKKDAKDIQVDVFVGTNWANTYFDTASLYLKKGANSANKRKYLDSGSKLYTPANCVNSNVINYMRLKLGDLASGDTIYLTWNMTRCASPVCGYAFYDLNWIYNFNYKNQCNSVTQIGNTWGKVYVYNGGTVGTWVPTDVNAGETKDFQFVFNSFYSLPMSKTGEIKIDLILPPTLEHSLSKSDFFITNGNLTATWYPDSIAMKGDTLRGYFGNSFKFDLSKAEMTVRLKGICSKYSGNTSLPVSMTLYYNPEPSCNPWMWLRPICVTFNTKVHCSKSCNGGLWFKNFEAYRSSYGLPDNDNNGIPDTSGSLDFTKIRRERAMFGDTITTIFTGRPKNTGSINNWRYGYAESFVTYGSYLDVADVNLIVYKGVNKQSGTCNSVRVNKVVSGVNATFKFDFTVDSIYPKGCLSSSYRFTQNDSILLVVRYKVAKNLNGASVLMNFSNRYYFGSVANPGTGQYFQCDTFGANMLLYGYYYANCCSDNVVYSNCAERILSQSWYLGIGPCCQNYAGNNLFQYEYRNFAVLKALRVHLPSGLKLGQTYFGQYRTTGVGSYVLEQNNNIAPQKGTSNPYVFDFRKSYTDSGGNIKLGDDGVQGYFSYAVQPRCNLPENTPIRINYDYIFERKGVLGSGYDTISSGYDLFTFNPPSLKLQPAIPTVYAVSDTVEWEIRYTNPSVGFNAYNIWLSPAKSTNIKVVEVRDMEVDTVIKLSKDIYRAGILPAGKIRRFKVRAIFNNCDPDSLILYGSYNCAEYPDDFASYPCKPNQTTLFLEPQNTRLQLTLTDSASVLDLCATNKMTLLVENIQAVTAYNAKVRLSLPIGMTVISGSAVMRYPYNSSPLSLGAPKLVSGTIYEWDLSKISNAIAKGFTGTSDTSRNKILIVFRVTTNCDYASGSFLSARAVSNIKCGNPIPSIPAFSNPQDIKGVTRPYYTLVKSWADTLLPCQKPMFIKSRVIFLGPNKSGTKDKIEIFLPNGVSRDTAYWNAVRNAPHKDSLLVSNINGASLLSWSMPSGINPGDSMEFDIRVNGYGPKLSCGPIDIITRSVVVQPVICISTNKSCDIKVITGSELANPVVDKGNIAIEKQTLTTKLISGDSEEVSLTYFVKNTGRNIDFASPVKVRYHFDRNNSGKWDVNDDFLGTDSFNRTIKKDSSFKVVRTLRIKAGMSCGLLAVVDSSACACFFGQKIFPSGTIENAGRDTAICSGASLILGTYTVKSFSYVWDNQNILDSSRIARPSFIAKNQSGVPEKHRLILTTTRGSCFSKDTVDVTVNPVPVLKILTKDTAICEKSRINLTSKTTGGNGGFTYSWLPVAGVLNPSSANTGLSPSAGATYKLKVTDVKGCMSSDSVKISVNPFPRTWFTWPPTCQGNMVNIKDSSYISQGSIALRLWKTPYFDTFGVSDVSVFHFSASKMPVTLITESDIGCADTLVRMVDVKANPKAGFIVPYACYADSSRFKNISTVDSGNITNFFWTFGDLRNSTAKNPVHKYSAYGDYTVKLKTATAYNCQDSFESTARVFPNPAAGFNATTPCEKDSIRFTNTSNLYGDTLKSWLWDFGKRGVSSLQSPSLYADTFGNYSTLLKVESIHGCIDTMRIQTSVFALPKSAFTRSNHCLGLKSEFMDSSTVAQGSVVKYSWNAGDGTTAATQNFSHIYSKAGTYNPKLKVETDKGCSDSSSETIIIYPAARPVFTGLSHCHGEQFSANSSTWGGGVPKTYRWLTGTGDSSGTIDLVYKYTSPGDYTVSLRVITADNCVRDTQALISVYPLPSVTAVNSIPCNDDSVVLNGNATISRGFIADYTWNISDFTTYKGKNLKKIFTQAAIHTATLIATSDKGCKDSAKATFRTNPKVVVDFEADDVCLDETTLFRNLSSSTEPITRYNWKFGDGRSSVVQQPANKYNSAGTFNAELSIETITGCIYTKTSPVVVHPKPFPGFSLDPKAGTIVNPNISIFDMSNGADEIWYRISDGFSGNQRNFSHTFPDSGSFRIWQVAKTDFNCYDSTYEDVFIHYMYTLFVPNTFTPNADTKNEMFGPGGLGIAWYNMQIYSRWGELVYETNDSKPWDGLINGQPAQSGVYAVLINIRDYKKRRHTYKGTVTILR